MTSEGKTVCLIPARGDSKRIRRKNLLPLCGKPLLSYTIEVALKADVFREVVVSSDEAEILDLADSLGVVPDRRPEHLSGDKIRFLEVVEEYLLRPEVRSKYANIACMLPTCPFRSLEDVREAYRIFVIKEKDPFLVAVTEYEFPPQLAMELNKDGTTLTMRDPETYARTTRSQSLRKSYHPNGAIYLASVEGFLREKTFFAEPLLGYVMPANRSFDIDYPYQFRIAELMMKELSQHDQE
jgi:CMP-N-acetylneuraminic acid synthetase